ncbi:methylenetetrahydrofolate reductase [NAD(P)H] [Nakamurella antarctica]|uniref:Methylenetetrahydrofolate reductase n=1 Tax=Nakamurella antarctica TaxID=1902245 RepID=A0A3G8ZVW2_9ACTN|nr:methylenetetrahydrofolate reductase [NAD(P)H] [Nakamurella antarctica]AZI57801.1 methylenetetrahydrofolate reductase [NAD(P)H] [Nakamurella antarctica]
METVIDRLSAGGAQFSVEFFPPKDDAGEIQLWRTIRELEPLRPAFVSVTYGAGGSSRDRTIRITGRIATETTLVPIAHLTAVNHTVAELRHVIGSYASVGVRNILALRGDMPGDVTAKYQAAEGGLKYASDLVRLAKSLGDFTVGVAAFPEMHPESVDQESDMRYLVEKLNAGADFATTQMLFSATDYLRLRDRLRAAGVNKPLVPGIMPIASWKGIARQALMAGQQVPQAVIDRFSPIADDPEATRAEGVQFAIEMCRQLLAEGVPTLHFYTMNKSRATLEILEALGITRARSFAAATP